MYIRYLNDDTEFFWDHIRSIRESSRHKDDLIRIIAKCFGHMKTIMTLTSYQHSIAWFINYICDLMLEN